MSGIAARERALLVDRLRDLGPDAPTLCEGWDTRHLVAHLVTRERRPDAMPGILVPKLHDRTARLESATLAHNSYDDLVRSVAGGPPLGPVGLPGMAELVNVHEFFIHHEDVRRAQPGWTPRRLPTDTVDALRRRLYLLAPLLFRPVRGVRISLETPDGHRRSVGHAADEVTIRGEVPELFLYAFGRRGAADVTVSGSEEARARLTGADLSR